MVLMHKYKLAMLGALLMTGNSGFAEGTIQYPRFRTDQQVDNYHGVKVLDPYRFLEDPHAPETKAWINAENAITFDYLKKIPFRDAIYNRLESLWDYEKYGIIFKAGKKYFLSKNNGLQNQSVLYTLDRVGGTPRVLLDPNLLSKDGTTALSFYVPSENGKFLAYGLSTSGSDWTEIRVRDVDSRRDFPDQLRWVKFSYAAWTKDAKGFFYCCYNEPFADSKYEAVNYNQKLYYHKLGTYQEEDVLIYESPDHKEWLFSPTVSEDGKYLIITVSQGTDSKNGIFYKDLSTNGPIVELLPNFDAQYQYAGNDGNLFWIKTNKDAVRSKLIAIDINNPDPNEWRELIPEKEDTLVSVGYVQNHFFAGYLQDAHSRIDLYSLDGTFEKTLALPSLGSAFGFYGKRTDTETFYAFTSFTQPSTIYRYDILKDKSEIVYQPSLAIATEDYETKQVFYESKDGTKVPLFLSYKKGLKYNGENPVYLYGYGGFGISLTPAFSPASLAWMEMGGVFAVAILRGGGEYGEAWHEAGKLHNKQNVFDDFIAGAEWLIKSKVTKPAKLAIGGASNGGLLVGACLTQRPELFGAATPSVGVMDMLRFHKFTIGWAWVPEYGSSEDPAQFAYLYKYSPLHNIRPGTAYPPTLVLTADHDDRVVPAHSFKFSATLQQAQGGSAPILIRIETAAGHGAGKPTFKLIDEAADKWAFIAHHLKMEIAE